MMEFILPCFILGESPSATFTEEVGGTPDTVCALWRREKYLALQGFELLFHDRPVYSFVCAPTELL
jgi:hypothetical protein